MKTLGIIPARGGSKGITNKNIKMLNGKPLIAYTIKLLKKCQRIDDFIVSTESDEIGEVALQFDASVLKRPLSLAEDDSSMADVVRHVAGEMPDYDFYATLYPTVPFREPEDVDQAIEKLSRSRYESLVSVTPVTIHPYGGYSIQGDDLITNIKNVNIYRRQDMKPLYQAMGGPYIVRKEFLAQLGNNMYTKHKTYFVIANLRAIDIDEEIDLKFAEFLLEKGYVG